MPIIDVTVRVRCELCRERADLVLDRAEPASGYATLDDVARAAALAAGFHEGNPGDWYCLDCEADDD